MNRRHEIYGKTPFAGTGLGIWHQKGGQYRLSVMVDSTAPY
jgi:hypothetical protein